MSIIYTSRSLPGSYGDYTNGAWSSFMNSYAVRFTAGKGGQGGGAFEGTTFYFSASVYFPNTGNYTVTAAADNSGSLNVAGQSCSVSGFNTSSSTTFYRSKGSYSLSGSVYNAVNGPSYATNPYGIAFTIDAPPPPPAPTVSVSWSPTAIIRGQCATLSWSSSGVALGSATLTNYSNPGYGGSWYTCPNNSGTYTYEVCGEGGCTSGTATLTVYIPPVVTLTLSTDSVIAGQCATLSWSVSGDGDTLYWPSGNISNANVTSSQVLCPEDTTTYCAYATGLGGTSPTVCKTLTVYQIPTIPTFNVPDSLNYGENGFIEYEVKYANISITIQKVYIYNTYTTTISSDSYTPCGTAELSGPNPTVSDSSVPTAITYDDFGPRSVQYTITAIGNGGQVVITKTIPIIIDETPDNINVEETDDLFKDQEPVYTPNIVPEEVIESDLYYIDGIDVPIEVKSNYPILIDKNKSDAWTNLREIGSAPPTGSSFNTFDTIRARAVEDLPLIARPKLNVPYENLVTCISIIDESSPSVATHTTDWSQFRNNYPYRTFYLLQPSINSNGSISYPISRLNMPNNYLADPYANNAIQVRRDNGSANFISDWFALCNLSSVPAGSYVSVWLDISGSMTYDTVSASYPYFQQRCADAGIQIVLETSDSGERWIPGHNKDLPPSGNIKIIDPSTGAEVSTLRIASGTCVTLTWYVFGEITTASVSSLGTLSELQYVSTQEVCPTQDTTYTLTAIGPAGTISRSVFIDVLVQPTLFLSASPNYLSAGSCSTLSWYTTGDADNIVWTSGNITNGNLTSQETVCPQETTSYCAYATGEGGTSPTVCVEVEVAQQPTAELTLPSTINYGDDLFIDFETQYADSSITISIIYLYIDLTNETATPISITPVALSAQLGAEGTIVAETQYQIPIDWNNIGPERLQIILTADGSGGSKVVNGFVNVNIDRTPDNIVLEETDSAFKDQDPVYTPDIVPTEVVESDLYYIDGIDIPVEIKSNYPIKIDVNKSDNWTDLRQI